jgi:putative component of membrane protein insertase Oxa1/YidC/SpoIIIJ protein YidD
MTAALPISPLACWLIDLYQRYISPRKGFCCAYRVRHRRRDSCSQYAKRAIAKLGLLPGVRLLGRRFDKCATACKTLRHEPKQRLKNDAARRRSSWADCAEGCDPGFVGELWDAAGAVGSGVKSAVNATGNAAGKVADMAVEGPNVSVSADGSGCADAGSCDVGSFDVGGCNAGACDVGGCDFSI